MKQGESRQQIHLTYGTRAESQQGLRPFWWDPCTLATPSAMLSAVICLFSFCQLTCLICLKSIRHPKKGHIAYTTYLPFFRGFLGFLVNEVIKYHSILLPKQPTGATRPQIFLHSLIRRGRLLRRVIKAGKVFTTVVRRASLW